MPDVQLDNLPSFAGEFLRLGDTADGDKPRRIDVLKRLHPDAEIRQSSWAVLLDAFEGSGGFLTGDYLWEYAREDSADYNGRKAQARYHNYLESLIDIFVRFIFTQGVKRESANQDYIAWLEDVDGRGTGIDDCLKQVVSVGLVHGHCGVLVDKTPDEPTGQTKADERGRVVLSVFTARSIADWRYAAGQLAAVKLFEAGPDPSLADDVPEGDDARQYLVIGDDGWLRFNAKGELIAGAQTGLGFVPLFPFRPKPSYTSEMIGRPLISNANIPRALFNRHSEEDEVLRSQAFSVLAVSVPADGNVDDAKRDLGTVIGTAKALVVKGEIDYKTPDQSVPGAIRENAAYLVQEMYRAAHVRFNRDSLDAESAEAIRLQQSELNEALQGMAKGLAALERQIAYAWHAWMEPTPDAADAAFVAAAPEITYPTEFFLDALMTDLEAWAEGLRMGLGPTMAKRIKRKAVRRIDPDIPSEDLKIIDNEIEAMTPEELNPMAALAAMAPDRGVDGNGDPVNDADTA